MLKNNLKTASDEKEKASKHAVELENHVSVLQIFYTWIHLANYNKTAF